ncbi:extracellular solute-binding protein [Cronbergia sp. UHCC 0137]|uniref:extracellular solute-binding protein n=1 Tax=Cronbergia sp. UHCC 0137 TaxID=3110239 RepID=UPI002B1FDB9B|nr:extracellular solute-binding protein [Cronbergia sp. UHCC 0137]MEA5617810.1 extracellular solute-binding protein [Cronbergia sp. UHCC 0137]
MDRRSFLLGTSALAVSQLVIGCGGKNPTEFKVQLLKGSIPVQTVNQFRKSLKSEVKLKFTPINQIQELFEQLKRWKEPKVKNNLEKWTGYIPFVGDNKVTKADLVTLGDYWLKSAIEQKLIEPIEIEKIKQWSVLDEKWQQLVKRDQKGNLSPQGKVWGVPYRWGNTVIVYNREKFQELGWQPKDWDDLWRNELRSRISLLNQPREVIGLVLKKLGKSYNTENIDQIPDLEQELQVLNQQVKFYDSTNYLEPLITGDTWLAVGWSSDVVSVLGRYPQLSAIVPQSGTAIWADLWVQPTGINKSALSSDWINFCWESNIAKQIAIFSKSNSPINPNIVLSDIQKPLQSLLLTNREVFDKSEFLLPLSLKTTNQYESLFTKIKMAG